MVIAAFKGDMTWLVISLILFPIIMLFVFWIQDGCPGLSKADDEARRKYEAQREADRIRWRNESAMQERQTAARKERPVVKPKETKRKVIPIEDRIETIKNNPRLSAEMKKKQIAWLRKGSK